MQVEIQVALNFILSYLYNKLPRTRVHLYGEELEQAIRKKFESHWYPNTPVKGSAYRCIHFNSSEIDPAFEVAAVRSGLDFHNDIKVHLPSPLSVWVDPGEVSYKISSTNEKSGTNILYKSTESQYVSSPSAPQIQPNNDELRFVPNDNQFGFNPNAKVFLPKCLPNNPFVPNTVPTHLNFPPKRRLYTVDEFASTKFGSTKMKSGSIFGDAVAPNSNNYQRQNPNKMPLMPTSIETRPQSLRFLPNENNQFIVTSPELNDYDLPSPNSQNFSRRSSHQSHESSSSTSSSIDNLNSPSKYPCTENIGIDTHWSSNAIISGYYKPEEPFHFGMNNWSSASDNDIRQTIAHGNEEGIQCQ